MLARKAKSVRGSRRWGEWDGHPLEGRQLMSVASPFAEVHEGSAHSEVSDVGGARPALSLTFDSRLTIRNETNHSLRIADVTYDGFDFNNSYPSVFKGNVIAPGHSVTRTLGYLLHGGGHFIRFRLVDASSGEFIMSAGADLDTRFFHKTHWFLTPRNQYGFFQGRFLEFHTVGNDSVFVLRPFHR